MNALSIMQSPYWTVAGWTMLHFLWVGSLAALAVAVGRLVLRRAAPQVRYAYTLVCFVLLAASPAAIAIWVAGNMPREEGAVHFSAVNDDLAEQTAWMPLETYPTFGDSLPPGCHGRLVRPCPNVEREAPAPYFLERRDPPQESPRPASLEPPEIKEIQQRGTQLAALAVTLLPWLWIAGTPLTLAMLLAGFVGAERLRRQSSTLRQCELAFLCDRLCQSLAIARQVTVGICDRIASPIVLGIIKPMILLPPAALAGWSPEQLEMVLLHELAHVRRWDNLVNLLQRLVESLLFFHPAVWVVSAWIRTEREHCCDAVVVAHTGRPEAYAETLASLAGASITPWATATAMAERNLTARIRRLLNLEDQAMRVSFSKLGFVIGTCVAAVLIVMSYAQEPGSGEPGEEAAVSSEEEVAIDEPAIADVAVDEEAAFEEEAFSDAVAAEEPGFDDVQSSDREAADAKARLRDWLGERAQYRDQLRKAKAELRRLKQQLAERSGEAVPTRARLDGTPADAETLTRALRENELRIAVLRDALVAFQSELKNPEESEGLRFLNARLKHLATQKKQLEQSHGELLARQRDAKLLNRARREEIERLKAAAEFMRQSLAEENAESATSSIRLAEEWMRKQIEKLEKAIEAPDDRRTSLLDPRVLQFNRARDLYNKAEASFRKSGDVVDPLAESRPVPADNDRGRIERLEREMQELKQMIRLLQQAVTSRAALAVPPTYAAPPGYIVPRPGSQVAPAQPIPGTWPQPRVIPTWPQNPQQSAVPYARPPVAVPRSAPAVPPRRAAPPKQRAEPKEPKPAADPQLSQPPKPTDEPAEPLDVPKEIEP